MELDLWAQLPSVLPEIGLTALALVVLFADIYGSPWRRAAMWSSFPPWAWRC